jgi:hypothetical protein
MKLWWHKLTHWEYWPVEVVYFLTFFYWIFLVIRFRAVDFYKYANLSIANGGLYGDSKMDIYRLLPEQYYPKTILIEAGQTDAALKVMRSNQMSYPLIVKPDIGCRGVGVQKVTNDLEMAEYAAAIGQSFLIQELVNYPNEIGLFYYRFPGESNGNISGITIKNFLTVKGNGTDTVEQLLRKNPRWEMQISKIRVKSDLNEVLENGVEKCLVPFGNHNRGTLFLDGSIYITDQMVSTWNAILEKVNGFNYGRLDIRFNSFAELEQGKNFSIIEINGAKSEPTHIYDPNHSFWYGQYEIFRHQRIMAKIVKLNMHSSSQQH